MTHRKQQISFYRYFEHVFK